MRHIIVTGPVAVSLLSRSTYIYILYVCFYKKYTIQTLIEVCATIKATLHLHTAITATRHGYTNDHSILYSFLHMLLSRH